MPLSVTAAHITHHSVHGLVLAAATTPAATSGGRAVDPAAVVVQRLNAAQTRRPQHDLDFEEPRERRLKMKVCALNRTPTVPAGLMTEQLTPKAIKKKWMGRA